MSEWLEPLFKKMTEQKDVNRYLLDGSKPVFVYGTGSFARDVFKVLVQGGVYVSAFLDHREPAPESLDGVPVLHPEAAKNAIVVIGIHNRAADILTIIRRLSEYGVSRVISSVEIFDRFGAVLRDRYWLTNREFYFSCKSFIERGRLLLKDDASRELYLNIIRFRLTGDSSVLPAPDFEHQYFSQDVPNWRMPLRLVDCGAFDGDTLVGFINAGIKIDAVAAFEPDDVNFSKLSKFVARHPSEIPDATLYPCGVYVSTTRLSFEIGHGEASAISNKGENIVQCVALDDVIPTFAPNLIKMDIEGAETDALLGARHIINTYLPGLAISIYHRPEHLWQIPMLVEDIAPGKYDFYIRCHAMSTFDTVLYCISKHS